MKGLNDIKELLSCLTAEEVQIARKHLKAFGVPKSEEDQKGLQLFDYLINNPYDLDAEKVKTNLYKGNIQVKTFYRQSVRLAEKIMESLILDVNVNRKDAYSNQYKAKISVRKKTLQASILLGRGKYKMALELYDKIIAKSKEYEIYDELIETLVLKQQLLAIRQDPSLYDQLRSEIEFYQNCRSYWYKARDVYHEVVKNIQFKDNPLNNLSLVDKAINELTEFYNATSSQNINYFLHYLKIEKCYSEMKLDEAVKYCLSLITIITEHPSIYMKRALAAAYIELANCYLLMEDFTECIKACDKAMQTDSVKSFNFSMAKEIMFFGLFHSKQYQHARTTIDFLLKSQNLSQSEFIRQKRIYMKSCIAFMEKDHKQVTKLLLDTRMLDDDKEGWNIFIRILDIMNDIERDLDKIAETKITNLRRHVERVSKSKAVVSKRIIHIVKVLYELEKSSFDFKKLVNRKPDLFYIDKMGGLDWNCRSSELVNFFDWFFSKAAHKPEKTVVVV